MACLDNLIRRCSRSRIAEISHHHQTENTTGYNKGSVEQVEDA